MKRTRPSSSSSSGSASPPPRPIRSMPKRSVQPVVQYLSVSSKMIPVSPYVPYQSSGKPTPAVTSDHGAKLQSKPRIPSDGSRTKAKWLTHRRPSDGGSDTTETSLEDAVDVGLADTSEVDDDLDRDIETAVPSPRDASPTTDEGDAVDDLIGYMPPPSSPPSEKYVKSWLNDVKGQNRQDVEQIQRPSWSNFSEEQRHDSHKTDQSLDGRSRSSKSMSPPPKRIKLDLGPTASDLDIALRMGGLQAGYESSGAWSTEVDKDEVTVDTLCQVPDTPTPASRSGRLGEDPIMYYARPHHQLSASLTNVPQILKAQMLDQSCPPVHVHSVQARPSVLGIAALKAKQRDSRSRMRRATRTGSSKPPIWTQLSASNPLTAQWYAYMYALTRARFRTRPDEYVSHLPGQHTTYHLRQSTTHLITGATSYDELLPFLRAIRLNQRLAAKPKTNAQTAVAAVCIGQINIQMILESIAFQRHRRCIVSASNRAAEEGIQERLKGFEFVIIDSWWNVMASEQEEEDVENECSLHASIRADERGGLLPAAEVDADVDDLAVENMFTARPTVNQAESSSPELSDYTLSPTSTTAEEKQEAELISRKRRARSESTEQRAEQAAIVRRERASKFRVEQITAGNPPVPLRLEAQSSRSTSAAADPGTGPSNLDAELQRAREIRAAAAASRLHSNSTAVIVPTAIRTTARTELVVPITRRLVPIPCLPSPPSSASEHDDTHLGNAGRSRGGRRLGGDVAMPTPSPSASLSPRRRDSALEHQTVQRRSSVSAVSETSELSTESEVSDTSTTISGPPNYDDIEPPMPISLPIARPPQPPRPAPQRIPRRQINNAHPPAYQHFLPLRGAAYSHTRTPSPPPPFNAQTDCQTLIAPVFVEDDEDEERVMRRITPSGQLRPSPAPFSSGIEDDAHRAVSGQYGQSRAMERVVSDPIVIGAFPRHAPRQYHIAAERPSSMSTMAQIQRTRAQPTLLAHSHAEQQADSFDAAGYAEQAAYHVENEEEDDDEVAAELDDVDDEGWEDDTADAQGTLGRLWRWAGAWIG